MRIFGEDQHSSEHLQLESIYFQTSAIRTLAVIFRRTTLNVQTNLIWREFVGTFNSQVKQ